MFPRITNVKHIQDYKLELTFSNGVQKVLDFKEKIVNRRGVFEPLKDIHLFRQVQVDPEAGTLVWPNGVDFCPDVLYSQATGEPIPEPQIT